MKAILNLYATKTKKMIVDYRKNKKHKTYYNYK